MPSNKYKSLEDRIIANSVLSFDQGTVIKGEWSPCWVWIGRHIVNRSGQFYGRITLRVRRKKNEAKIVKNFLVHRIVLVVFKGRRLTKKTVVRHLCNNTLCVNPGHLMGGTQSTNIKQCYREGRRKI
jgi:hypothetical protein